MICPWFKGINAPPHHLYTCSLNVCRAKPDVSASSSVSEKSLKRPKQDDDEEEDGEYVVRISVSFQPSGKYCLFSAFEKAEKREAPRSRAQETQAQKG